MEFVFSKSDHILLLYWHFSFLHPAGRFSLPYHPLSLVLKLDTDTSSLSLKHVHKPWQCTFLLCPAGRCLLLSSIYPFFNFHLVQIVSNHINRPLWSFRLWRKMSHCIVAMLMSTNLSLIPGINHYSLLGLAPASTMVKVRMERLATEASCPTKKDLYVDGWLVILLYNICYSFIQNFQISSE